MQVHVRTRRIGERTFVTIDKALRRQLIDLSGQAQRSLAAAAMLRETGSADVVTARLKEAVLCALRAALLSRDIAMQAPAALTAGFHDQFVHTNVFPGEFDTRIAKLFRAREARSRPSSGLEHAEAKEDLQHARIVVTAIVEYLRREGFLGAA